MHNEPADQTVFLTLVGSIRERESARLLIDSIRSFGGALGHSPIWLFEGNPPEAPCNRLQSLGVRVLPLTIPGKVARYYYSAKVHACARAEDLATSAVRSLIWLSPEFLVVNPPLLLDLAPSFDAAVRPVHFKNVGLLAAEPLDDFWKQIYETVGTNDVHPPVESFLDALRIRPYFNTHAFALDPQKGLCRRWLDCFESLVCDRAFQLRVCSDQSHQVFLHQAILSAIIVTMLAPHRIRALPPEYNYPYNLHPSVPLDRRAPALNDLVTVAYDDRPLDPRVVDDIDIHEPLRSWLSARFYADPLREH